MRAPHVSTYLDSLVAAVAFVVVVLEKSPFQNMLLSSWSSLVSMVPLSRCEAVVVVASVGQ